METLLLGICGHCESQSHTKIGISATLNAKGTRALDKLQTTSVTKELRGFSDKPDVSVDPNSHSFGLTTLNHVVHVWVLIKKLNIACKTWHYSLEDSCERVKEKKKNIPRLKTCVLWSLANYEFVDSAFLKVALLIQRLQLPPYHISLHLLTIHENNTPDSSPFTAIDQSILFIEGNERVNHIPGLKYLHICPLHQQKQQIHLLCYDHLL